MRGTGSIPGWGTKILHAAWCKQTNKTNTHTHTKINRLRGLTESYLFIPNYPRTTFLWTSCWGGAVAPAPVWIPKDRAAQRQLARILWNAELAAHQQATVYWVSPLPSEKAGLKLNIQKTKIMASSPITSWQIDEETMETVTDYTFLGSKITADGDCSHGKRCLLLGRKPITNLDNILESRHITLPTKVHIVKVTTGFTSYYWFYQ